MLILTLILADEPISAEQIWEIYFHFYLDDQAAKLLGRQASKLAFLSESLEAWNSSVYGSSLRFCDEATLSDVRGVWLQYAEAAATLGVRDTEDAYNTRFRTNLDKSRDYKRAAWGPDGQTIGYTNVKAAAPLSMQMFSEILQATDQHWATGLTACSQYLNKNITFPNPMFAISMSENLPLAFPSDPLIGFHLATAQAKLTEASPLRIPDSTSKNDRLFRAAMVQFKEWIAAFREAAPRITIHFVSADGFSFCHTLQHNLETNGEETTAHLYRRELGFQPLELASTDYGKGGTAPKQFDVIDTSNIADYNGAVNLLISAGPLLKKLPSSTLYTELMARGMVSDSKKFDALLYGHTKTISILLGLAPIEYWTDATAVSVVDECLLALATSSEGTKGEGLKLQARLAWKHDRFLSGQPTSVTDQMKLCVKPEDLADIAFKIYLQMFDSENADRYQQGMQAALLQQMAKEPFPKNHRVSFAAFLKAVCKNVKTDPAQVGRLVMERISADSSLAIGNLHLQALDLELSKMGIFSQSYLTQHIKRDMVGSGVDFCKWKELPEAVAVTIVIPPTRWKPVYERALEKKAVLSVESHLRCLAPGQAWHNIYSAVQISFGKVVTRGSRDEDDYKVTVQEDDARWAGNSPMIASFYASTAALQVKPQSTSVGLALTTTSNNVVMFQNMLGSPMFIFEKPLLDYEHVFVSKKTPGLAGYRIIGGTLAEQQPKEGSANNSGPTFTANIDAATGDIVTITGHVDIDSDKGKKLLADKTVPIELAQDVSSPFTIDITFGSGKKKELTIPLTFSVPVLKEGSKTRVARKSQYIEVIAPVASPISRTSEHAASPALDGFVFPTVPFSPLQTTRISQKNKKSGGGIIPVSTLSNLPHLNLDALPILDLSSKERIRFLTTLSSFVFSARERRIRAQVQANPTAHGLSEASARLNLKESIFTMFMLASGLQGGQTGLFGLVNNSAKSKMASGLHMIVFVSAIRLDLQGKGVVLDAAVLGLTRQMVDAMQRGDDEYEPLRDFFLVLEGLEMARIDVDEAELGLWKRTLPGFAERCRGWGHRSDCDYVKAGGGGKEGVKVPVSVKDGEPVLCSCGRGKLPQGFINLPDWEETAKRYATRVAISLPFPSPFVENVVDPEMAGMFAGVVTNAVGGGGSSSSGAGASGSMSGMMSALGLGGGGSSTVGGDVKPPPPADLTQLLPEGCRCCGRADGPLKKCMRCLKVKYCSAECQRKDWKKHKMECTEAEEYGGMKGVGYQG